MALSGSFTGSTSNEYIQPKITWSATQSVSGNYSDVTATLYYSRTNTGYTTSGTWSGSITINGTAKSGSKTVSLTYNSNTQVISNTVRVYHNTDGSKSITIKGSGSISGTTLSSTSISKTITLDTIARKATISTAPNFNDEGNPAITYSNPAGNVVDSVEACIASEDGDTVYVPYRSISKTGTSYTFNLTDSERTTLRTACNTANSMYVKFYIRTKIGDTTSYSSLKKTLTIVNATPTLNPTVTDTNSKTVALTGDANILVIGQSTASFNAGATAKKNATIKSYSMVHGSTTKTTATGTLTPTTSTFTFSCKDSRGNTASNTVTKTTVSYVNLTCNQTESMTPDGIVNIGVTGNYFNGSFGATANTLTVQYRYKESGGSYSEWTNMSSTKSGNKYSATVTLTGLDYRLKYVIQTRAVDKLLTKTANEKTVSCYPVFDWGENSFNFNVQVTYTDTDGEFNLSGLAKALTTAYSLDVTGTVAGSNWTLVSSRANLYGNNLRCYFESERKSALAAGDQANETVVSYKIKHSGKIKASYAMNFVSGAYGGVTNFVITDAANDGTYLTFNVKLCATASSLTKTSSYFILPVIIDTTKY